MFIEAVATDGAVTERRREALLRIAEARPFKRSQIAFVTAYSDRAAPGFRRTVTSLAWGSFAWLASEPDGIIQLRKGDGNHARLSELMAVS